MCTTEGNTGTIAATDTAPHTATTDYSHLCQVISLARGTGTGAADTVERPLRTVAFFGQMIYVWRGVLILAITRVRWDTIFVSQQHSFVDL